jgi:hypothetical protein
MPLLFTYSYVTIIKAFQRHLLKCEIAEFRSCQSQLGHKSVRTLISYDLGQAPFSYCVSNSPFTKQEEANVNHELLVKYFKQEEVLSSTLWFTLILIILICFE